MKNDWDIRMLEWDMLFPFLFLALSSCFIPNSCSRRERSNPIFSLRRDNITVHPPTCFLPPYYNDNHPTMLTRNRYLCMYFGPFFSKSLRKKTPYLRIQDEHRYRLYSVLITIQLSTRLPNLNDVRPLVSQIYTTSTRVPNLSRSATHFFSTWKIKNFLRSQLMYIYP